MATHELKTWREPFQAILDGIKTHEIRKSDRPFCQGDTLFLREWDPGAQDYTGRHGHYHVTYLSRGGRWGLPEDLVVMSIREEEDLLTRACDLLQKAPFCTQGSQWRADADRLLAEVRGE